MDTFRVYPLQEILFDEQVAVAAPMDVQILRVGTFFDPRYGELKITPEILAELKANHDARVRGVDIAIDYSHEAEKVAAGWIKEVFLSADGMELWAKVDWTRNGQKVLGDKEFRYLSAEFTLDYQDNESLQKHGPTLLGAGLTNRPVIKGMAPVVELHELTHEGMKMKELEAAKEEIKKLSEQVQTLQTENKKLMDGMEGMNPEQMMAMIQELQAKLAALQNEKEMAEAEKKKAEEAVKCAEQKARFDKLLSDGKAVEAQREAFLSGDTVKFAELAVAVNMTAAGTAVEGDKVEGTPEEQIMKFAEAKLEAKEVKTLGEAISAVLKEKPELAKAYQG